MKETNSSSRRLRDYNVVIILNKTVVINVLDCVDFQTQKTNIYHGSVFLFFHYRIELLLLNSKRRKLQYERDGSILSWNNKHKLETNKSKKREIIFNYVLDRFFYIDNSLSHKCESSTHHDMIVL